MSWNENCNDKSKTEMFRKDYLYRTIFGIAQENVRKKCMADRKNSRILIQSFILMLFLFLISGIHIVEAEKLPPPPSRPDQIELPSHAGTEVWVETPRWQREEGPKSIVNEFAAGIFVPSTTVVINEFDQFNDDIEFYNLSAAEVDLSGWVVRIYIGANSLYSTYFFPAGFVLNSGEYVVLHENGDPIDNSATDLYTGDNLAIQSLGGAIVLSNGTNTAVDFVRWNVGMLSPPSGTGWVGTNPYLPEEVEFSLGRDASSLDRDFGADWSLQVPSYGKQNDPSAPLCVQFWPVFSGNGENPTYFPSQSTGCEPGYFIPGETIVVTASPDPGWEVGQWAEQPAHGYLGTDLSVGFTMTLEHSYLWLSYIHSDPAPGSALIIGMWGDYSYTLDDLDVPYDQIGGHTYAPDWDVLNRYDLVIYQAFDGEPFYINQRASNYGTYLDGGGCMWVEADVFDQDPEEYAPNIPYFYFGINAYGTSNLANTVNGTGTLYDGTGPFDDPMEEYYSSLTPYNGAEVAFKDETGNAIGVVKLEPSYTTGLISFDINNLSQLEQAEIITPFLDTCEIPNTGYDFPTNNDIDSPLVISNLNYTNTQGALSVLQATTAGDDPNILSGQRYHTVWYSYMSSSDQEITVNTFGSDYDTIVGVWTGTRGNLTAVAINDDSNSTLQSLVQFSAIAGTPYYFEVASYDQLDYGTLVLNVVGSGGFIFWDDFETGDFSRWYNVNSGGGFVYICSQAAMSGTYGACIRRGTNDYRKQLVDNSPKKETSLSVRFNFDIHSISMGVNDPLHILKLKKLKEVPAHVVVKHNGSQYFIRLITKLDDLTKVKSSWIPLSDEPHTIEVDWQAASVPGANDGFAELYIDGVLKEALTGLDNDTLHITHYGIGITNLTDGLSFSGKFFIDDVGTSNLGYIGLP
jgi:hypothetical protein